MYGTLRIILWDMMNEKEHKKVLKNVYVTIGVRPALWLKLK